MRKLLFICYSLLGIYLNVFAGLGDLVISEGCINNDTTLQNENGDYADWFELYNAGSITVNLNGLYLSDDKAQLLKHQITSTDLNINPGEYLLLWADGETALGSHHVNFKLSKGERLTLFSLTEGIVDTVTFTNDEQDISYGREVLNHNNNWFYYTTPTPGTANAEGYLGFTSDVKFSVSGGSYSSDQIVELYAEEGEQIVYTLDNYDPDSSSIFYAGEEIKVTKTTVVRARTFREGYIPGEIISHIYLINEESTLPFWSVITDPDNLTGETGIYSHPWSEGIEWERFAQHQYIVDDTLTYGGNSGIRIQGGNSVGMAKKSFRLHFRDKYGNNRLEYPIFQHSDVKSFKQIVLKSGYDDDLTASGGTLLRDPFSMEMWRLTGNLASASEWTSLMLNDQYWGIYNLRESVDEEFIEDHLATNQFDMIRYQKTGPELKHGTWAEWDSLTNFFNTTDFTKDEAYDQAAELIDMDNFLNLLAFVHCTQYRSWTWGASAYKGYKKDDRWCWTIWDTDRSYLQLNWNGFAQYAYTSAEKWGNFMPQKLLKNTRFKNALINRVADFNNSWFRPDRSVEVLDSIKTIIAPEINKEQNRWSSSQNWENNVRSMRTFLQSRPGYLRDQIVDHFDLINSAPINLIIEGKGIVKVNSLTITEFPWRGYYFLDIPVTLTAIPAKGYKFESWSTGSTDYSITHFNTYLPDTVLYVTFIEDTSTSPEPIVINEIMYHPSDNSPSGDWVELYNKGAKYDLSGWWMADENSSNKFTFPLGTVIDSAEYLVVAQNMGEFSSINDTLDLNCIGGFGDGIEGFGFGNGGDCVKLYNLSGELVDSVCYDDKLPWPVLADGYGYSLQLKDADSDNSLATNWDISRALEFTPGTLNSVEDLGINTLQFGETRIYPNPASEFVEIFLPEYQAGQVIVELFSLTGKSLLHKSIYLENGSGRIRLSTFVQGSYILKITSQQSIWTKKLIIK